ncbi:hypothetical protein BMF94_4653 [Rhodotorula taiwanensis]|uniref:Signal recognition particle subunit SRP68 n=1 Tax=Rhodotorula taiwanensis TaxID=741276 RepID=A0A2S5B6L0_9BASI|nr:hypothetical protein BMF94_4653 [Rhodotorula taiwanensis]
MAERKDTLDFPRRFRCSRQRPRAKPAADRADLGPTFSPGAVLQLVSNARATYGLRHQDYARYKSHCVAKVHHLRKAAGLSQKAGKSRKYERKELTADKVTSAKSLQVLLFDAERDWAQAQSLKSQHAGEANAKAKHHYAKRFTKAAGRAADLLAVAQAESVSNKLSASQKTQIHTYALVMSGTSAFERSRYEDGLNSLGVAHGLLGKLATTAGSATEEALANEMLDDVEPMLRFCAYRLGKDTSAGIASIAEQVANEETGRLVPDWESLRTRLEEQGQQSKKASVEIRWQGQAIPIRNAELVNAAAKVQDALAGLRADQQSSEKVSAVAQGKKPASNKKDILGARRMGMFDKALLVLSEAEATAAQLVEDNKIAMSKGNSARFEASSKTLATFHAYVQYHLLAVRAKRDLLLVASTQAKLAARERKILHAEEAYVAQTERRDPAVAEGKIKRLRAKVYPGLIKVFDTILLSFEGMRDMEAVEQDDDLATLVEARISYVGALRSQYLSRGYALAGEFPSSLALNAQAKLKARQARFNADATAGSADVQDSVEDSAADHDYVADRLPLDSPSLDSLDAELEADYQKVSQEWFAATGGKVEGRQDDLDLSKLSLSADVSRTSKTTIPKVPFFDVAYNYVTAFDMDAIAEKAGLRIPTQAAAAEVPTAATITDEAQPVKQEVVEEQSMNGEQEAQPTPTKRGWGFGLFGRG